LRNFKDAQLLSNPEMRDRPFAAVRQIDRFQLPYIILYFFSKILFPFFPNFFHSGRCGWKHWFRPGNT